MRIRTARAVLKTACEPDHDFWIAVCAFIKLGAGAGLEPAIFDL